MTMGINTNLALIHAQRILSSSQSSLATSMQKLSSGLRVNSAKDDAAGLAIAERMHSQIRGMNQAARNANDGISLLQTAEGASSKITDMLQRMREIAVQSANATNSAQDRKALQAEISQLKQEIDRVGLTTKFNGLKVFDQSRSPVAGGNPDAHVVMQKLRDGWLAHAEQLVKDRYGIEAPAGEGMRVNLTTFTDGKYNVLASVGSAVPTSGPGNSITLNIDLADFKDIDETEAIQTIAHEMVHAVMAKGQSWGSLKASSNTWFTEGVAEFVYGADSRIQGIVQSPGGWGNISNKSITDTWGSDNNSYGYGYIATRVLHEELKANGVSDGIAGLLQQLQNTNHATLEAAVQATISAASGTSSNYLLTTLQGKVTALFADTMARDTLLNLSNADTGGIGGADADGGTVRAGADSVSPDTTLSSNTMNRFAANWESLPSGTSLGQVMGFQVGANAGDFVYTNVGSMNLGSLGIESLDVSTAEGVQNFV